MSAVGVDACRGGWIAVALSDAPGGPATYFLPTIDSLTELIPNADGVAIDIPIGLPEGERRLADIEAKEILGPRRNSIFFTPPRAVLEAPDHRTATRLSIEVTGKGLSQQSYALRKKIFEVERWLPESPVPVWEVHPEVSFTYLLGSPPEASKKTWAGSVERRVALLKAGIDLDHVTGPAATMAATDDMLDAAAAAWSAQRLINGGGRSIPDPPERDLRGRPVAIWF